MTKRRPHSSRHEAFMLACQELGWDVASDLLGLSEARLRKISDPDADGEPSIWQCETLDRALKAEGLEPYNIRAYGLRIGDKPITVIAHLTRARDEIKKALNAIDGALADPAAVHDKRRLICEIVFEINKLQKYLLDAEVRSRDARRASVVDLDRERRA